MEEIDYVDNEIMRVGAWWPMGRPLTCHPLAGCRVNTDFAFTLTTTVHCCQLKHVMHLMCEDASHKRFKKRIYSRNKGGKVRG